MKTVDYNNGGKYRHQCSDHTGTSYIVIDSVADDLYDIYLASGETPMDDMGTFDCYADHLYQLSGRTDVSWENCYTEQAVAQ